MALILLVSDSAWLTIANDVGAGLEEISVLVGWTEGKDGMSPVEDKNGMSPVEDKNGMSPVEGRIESEVLLSEIEAQLIYS